MSRREEFFPDGRRVVCHPAAVAAVWRLATMRVPPQYACGTAEHESSYTLNEVDTEESGFVSKGVFQISDEEVMEACLPDVDLLSLTGSVRVLSWLAERRLDEIAKLTGFDPAKSLVPDVCAYLTIAHNQGLNACLKSIAAHGLNWESYKKRNIAVAERAVADAVDDDHRAAASERLAWWRKVACYGDDAISGGSRWSEAL